MDSIIRWAGSKRQLLSKLKAFWSNENSRYVEPFCGSACLFFNLQPGKAILGDLNAELIGTYEALRNDAYSVCDHLQSFPKSKEAYYTIRDLDPSDLSETHRAARFLYLNRYCFNGIYRTNRSGKFNVPRGKQARKVDFDYAHIISAANMLSQVKLVNGDFAVTLEQVNQSDFVYLDPPYAVANRKIFSEYQPNSFNVEDLKRLKCWLIELDQRGASFVISYADSVEARELLAPWQPRRVWVRRHVAGFAANRRGAYEIIATNIITHAE